MTQSLSHIYVHIIFSTYNREKLLDPTLAARLWEYLASLCSSSNCTPVKIGGTDDHVHILCELSREITVRDLISKLKTASSKWIKNTVPDLYYFRWQGGYGVFSINPSEKTIVIDYIANQKKHHNKFSFQEELTSFLKKYGVDYNEKFLWE